MKTLDLTKILKPYISGWVAIKNEKEVVAHADSFEEISEKVKNIKNIFIMPASKDYSGSIV